VSLATNTSSPLTGAAPNQKLFIDATDSDRTPKWIITVGFYLPWALLILLAVTFGGVHPKTILSAQLVLCCAAIPYFLFMLRGRVAISRTLTVSRAVIASLLWLTLATPLFAGALTPQTNGLMTDLVSRLSSPATISYLQYGVFLLIAFVIFRISLLRGPERGIGVCIGIGALTATIALSHWLNDNGRLFWYFAPTNEFLSPRARWPFVNPDHLAHFLIPAFFLLLGEVRLRGDSLVSFAQQYDPSGNRGLAALLGSRRFQSRLGKLGLILVALLVVSIAIAGTLCRSAWLAISIGLVGFLVIDSCLISDRDQDESEDSSPPQNSARRGPQIHNANPARARKHEALWARARYWSRPLVLLISVGIFLFFLNERGQELLAERIEYGLLNSKDDIRWHMYRDTLPVLKQNILTGVGIGNWEPFFKHAMEPALAGINPVYLHSDPLQYLTETGLLGTLPILILSLLGSYWVLRKMSQLSRQRQIQLAVLFVSAWSVLIASCFDFPFRIPAIALQFTLLLALLCSWAEDPQIIKAKVVRRGVDIDSSSDAVIVQ
jgi:O-antigen ligase